MRSDAGGRVERIGARHLLAAAPALEELGEVEVARRLRDEVEVFFQALGAHARRPAGDTLSWPEGVASDGVVKALLAAADVLRQDDDADRAALGAWCCAVAAHLGALEGADVEVERVRVERCLDDSPVLVIERCEEAGAAGAEGSR